MPQKKQARQLPDFLCVGVEKCGTTSFYDLLAQHPHIGLSSNKETHFFSTEWHRGVQWYQEKFSHLDEQCQHIGEITPAYHRFPECIERIQKTLGPDIKIIFLLRDPVKRAMSHYVHDAANTLVLQNEFLFKTYLKTTPYTPVVQDYMEAFGKENVLVLIFEEDFLPDPQIAMDKTCEFLGIESSAISKQHSNPSYFPVFVDTPAEHDSLLIVEDEEIPVPAGSMVGWTGRKKNTRVFPPDKRTEAEKLKAGLASAKTCIPAENQAVVYEKTSRQDVLELQQLIDRDLSCWGQYNEDLIARHPPEPQFLQAD